VLLPVHAIKKLRRTLLYYTITLLRTGVERNSENGIMWAPQQNANVRNEVYCTSKTESMCAHEEIQGIGVSIITARCVREFFFLTPRYECLYQVRQRDVCMSATAGRLQSSRTKFKFASAAFQAVH
jgi:hypothetical protein